MQIKLLASLAVVIALISAMTFVALYGKSQSDSSAEQTVTLAPGPISSSAVQNPSPDATTGSSHVATSVDVGGGDVQTRVVIQ